MGTHASAISIDLSVPSVFAERSSNRGHRERSPATATRRIPATAQAPGSDDVGSSVLGESSQPVVRVARSVVLRPAGHGLCGGSANGFVGSGRGGRSRVAVREGVPSPLHIFGA